MRARVSRVGARVVAIAVAVAAVLSLGARASAQELGSPARESAQYGGWALTVDNDLFAATENDRDYTGGIAFTVSGPQLGNTPFSLDPLLRRIDRLALGETADAAGPSWVDGDAPDSPRQRTVVLHSAQLGIASFTPQDITSEEIQTEDRPYASLLYVTSARQYVDPAGDRVRHSAFTLGVIGLSLTSDLHDVVHKAVGSELPRGYDHQVSAGGEPTFRYVLGESKLRGQRLAFGSGLLETKTTAEMSVGYITEASYAISTRFGSIGSPWWSFNPERIDYMAQPGAVVRNRGGSELYFWAGAKLRVRAYNSLLQGQFRDSAHAFSADEVEHVIGEAWLGLTSQLGSGTTLSYSVRYQTSELSHGLGRRDPVWAGITLTHSF